MLGLSAQHAVEQLHIPSGGNIPAEILAHIPVLQRPEAIPVAVVQPQEALQRLQEIVGIVALEGEAQAVFAVFIHAGHGVL